MYIDSSNLGSIIRSAQDHIVRLSKDRSVSYSALWIPFRVIHSLSLSTRLDESEFEDVQSLRINFLHDLLDHFCDLSSFDDVDWMILKLGDFFFEVFQLASEKYPGVLTSHFVSACEAGVKVLEEKISEDMLPRLFALEHAVAKLREAVGQDQAQTSTFPATPPP